MEPGIELNKYTRYMVLQPAHWGRENYITGQIFKTYNTEFFDRYPLIFKRLAWWEFRKYFPSWTTKEMVEN
jgi:hypothetical protein